MVKPFAQSEVKYTNLLRESMKKHLFFNALALLVGLNTFAQNLPYQWTINDVDHKLTIGGVDGDDLYDPYDIKVLELTFEQSNYWQQLEANYDSQTPIEATLTYNGESLSQVGARFKGQTSYFMNNTDKKSFNLKLDEWIDDQDLLGYEALNLQNGFLDPSFMREFLYQRLIRKHIPTAQSAFTQLIINGESWGLYPNVEQLNSEFIDEWFLSSSGTRWRADEPASTGGGGGGGGGGGPQWGDGTAALNYLGSDASDYEDYYTLKTTSVDNPWDALIQTCDILENTPLDQLTTELPNVLDVDRTLWFLASEILFSDDDGYCYKGKMDYFLYWEPETGRMVPLEYDGNTVMEDANVNWSVFYNASNENYPLLYRMLQVEEYRQRYLAHVRVMLEDTMNPDLTQEILDAWSAMIDLSVEEDPKKIYNYNQFVNEVANLQEWAEDRHDYLLSNNEVAQSGIAFSSASMSSPQGEWANPMAYEAATITASVEDNSAEVMLFWSNELVGNFSTLPMTLVDGQFQAEIPGQVPGTVVRFYFESIANNGFASRVYEPAGAEHDTYYYVTDAAWAAASDLVINELMAKNEVAVFDETNEADDWIELYNNGTEAIDLTDYHLTDNLWNLDKWPIPEGYILGANEYLIIWADEDGSDGEFHANFKLEGSGETVILLNPDFEIVDYVEFGQQETDVAYARVPNGTGDFLMQGQTAGSSNDGVNVSEALTQLLTVYPNPAKTTLTISLTSAELEPASIYSSLGQVVWTGQLSGSTTLDVSGFANGMYLLKTEQLTQRVVINR
ncbi:MAG: spore coat protein CotH [Flavobacteriales bacterium]|jgi:spore coat protein CotH